MKTTHCRCDWCRHDASYLEAVLDEYRAKVGELDAEVERLGGPMNCAEEDGQRVHEMGSEAASLNDDACTIETCLSARM